MHNKYLLLVLWMLARPAYAQLDSTMAPNHTFDPAPAAIGLRLLPFGGNLFVEFHNQGRWHTFVNGGIIPTMTFFLTTWNIGTKLFI